MSHEKKYDTARGMPRGQRLEHRPEPEIDPTIDLGAEPDFDPDIAFDADLDADLDTDPPRDPALGAALRALTRGAATQPDWARLSASIRATAAPRLALRREPAPWWQHAAGWARQAIPVGLAAGVALTVGLRILGPGARVPDQFAKAPAALDEVLAAIFDEPQGELAFPADRDELLLAALLRED